MTSQGTTESDRPDSPEQEDRVVSRRVDNPTDAAPGDADVYRAADPAADPNQAGTDEADPNQVDTDEGGTGSTAVRAGHDLDTDDGSEPTRSE